MNSGGDIYLLTYLGKPVIAYETERSARDHMDTYSPAEQSLMQIIPVRLDHS